MIKNFFYGILSVFISIILLIIIFEALFRILPVSEASLTQNVSSENPYLHFKKDRTFNFSRGYNFEILAQKKSNNYGFLDDDDFDQFRTDPLMTIIGDSFVEAMQVNHHKTFHGILDIEVANKGRVYAIGSSGSPLSQYLAYANFAISNFKPDSILFSVVSNDFYESFLKYKSFPGHHYFEGDVENCQNLNLILVPFNGHNQIIKIVRSSAFLRYIVYNLGFSPEYMFNLYSKIFADATNNNKNIIDWNSEEWYSNNEVIQDSKCSVKKFFKEVEIFKQKHDINVAFIIDAPRPNIYGDETFPHSNFFSDFRTYFIDLAKANDYEVIDLAPVFYENYQKTGVKFEYELDAHWNEYAHKLIAEKLLASEIYKNTYENE